MTQGRRSADTHVRRVDTLTLTHTRTTLCVCVQCVCVGFAWGGVLPGFVVHDRVSQSKKNPHMYMAKRSRRSGPDDPTQTFGALSSEEVSAVCLGSGRFLRAVLVPMLQALGSKGIAIAQARGTSFCEYMRDRTAYEVDTMLTDGRIVTETYSLAAVGTLGLAEGRRAFMQLPSQLPTLKYIGVGLTEAGFLHNATAINDLADFLHACSTRARPHVLSVINTDNVPCNGDRLEALVRTCDATKAHAPAFLEWLAHSVKFHNTMVDRITSHRPGEAQVPCAEPLPLKALVIEDIGGILPAAQLAHVPGMHARTTPGALARDLALKLRVANATHTAMVYAMALSRRFTTERCAEAGSPVLSFLCHLFEADVFPALLRELDVTPPIVSAVFSEWVSRLTHAHFGLDALFVCQNATQKIRIRLLPTVKASLAAGDQPSDAMMFALAAALRFLTPMGEQPRATTGGPPVFRGRLDPAEESCGPAPSEWNVTSELRVSPKEGWYEFTDEGGQIPRLLMALSPPDGAAPQSEVTVVTSRVLSGILMEDGATAVHDALLPRVAALLGRMLTGESALGVMGSLTATGLPWMSRQRRVSSEDVA